jgi:hypothetical protein
MISPLVCVTGNCTAVPGWSNNLLLCGEVGDRKPGRKRHLEIEAESGRSLGNEKSIVVGRREGRGAVGGDAGFDRDRSLSSIHSSENG